MQKKSLKNNNIKKNSVKNNNFKDFLFWHLVSYLQWGREIDVAGSMGTSSENFHEEHVTFTLNRLIITDKEKCAEEIIKKCRENDFASTLFSYDVAKPNALYFHERT